VTLLLMSQFDINSRVAAAAISTVLGVMLLLTALSLVFRRRFISWVGWRFENLPPQLVANLTIATGVALGVLVTISSVGAGAIGVTVLLLLYPRLPMATIVGSP
jgi:uncharacterized membrane protein YfcA